MFNPFNQREEEQKKFDSDLKKIKDPKEQLNICIQYLNYLNDLKEGLTVRQNIVRGKLKEAEDAWKNEKDTPLTKVLGLVISDEKAMDEANSELIDEIISLDKKIKKCDKKIKDVEKKITSLKINKQSK